ncbi:methylmalonyl-CoA mutase [candidate division WOR-3 bacterium]|uniref:Methylmalonyl-CoA mutase n=1 Tax=candidate division WOR-3 bacterium TaxID=2052148 RepID=A0A938BT27_UNCW3|nr:methylmalonyl-CoA mutase [candidate division WOR-3 bacterium]
MTNDESRKGGPDVDLRRVVEKWEQETVAPVLKKAPERAEAAETVSGLPLNRAYTPDASRLTQDALRIYAEQLGMPGEFPFTRGVQPTMYRSRFWTMRQYAGFGSAEDTNKRYHYLLGQGQTGLSVAFDLPTQMGYDSDSAMAKGEVGKVGVAISSLEDMETLFAGIPLDKVSTSMTINATAGILLAMYCVVAEKQGKSIGGLAGTIQNDILKEYVARGTYIFPPRPSLRLVTDIIAWCAENVPKWNTVSVSGYHIREAGATAVQEVAFTIADGLEYIRAALSTGLAIDKFAPRLSFFFAAHSNIIEEVAKFRAARRLWARLLRERWNASDESCKLRFHTQTGGVTLTAQQPENNVIRVAYQALAAALGGTQSLHTNSRDEALALPSEESVLIALRTQQIVAHESGVADIVDPLAGSYAVESLTDEMEERARELIGKVEQMGGVVSAIEQGFMQNEIADSAYKYQQAVEKKQRIVVGVNKYTEGIEGSRSQAIEGKLLRVDQALGDRRAAELSAFRRKREAPEVAAALTALKDRARGTGNLMEAIVAAVRTGGTVGEISDALRTEFGEYDRQR